MNTWLLLSIASHVASFMDYASWIHTARTPAHPDNTSSYSPCTSGNIHAMLQLLFNLRVKTVSLVDGPIPITV